MITYFRKWYKEKHRMIWKMKENEEGVLQNVGKRVYCMQ